MEQVGAIMNSKSRDSRLWPSMSIYEEECLLHWSPTSQVFDALNCDGAVFGAGYVPGCGGILRDGLRNFVFSFSHKLEQCSVQEEELWAIYHGTQYFLGERF